MRFLMSGVIAFLLLATSGAEAEPVWWWDCKQDDVVVKGRIEYGSSPDISITHSYKGTELKSYYILGTLKVEKWLYLASQGRYLDNYRYLVRELPGEVPVLLGATALHSMHERPGDPIRVTPWPQSIPQGSFICVLNQNYVFPIGDLTVESPVPPDQEKVALALVSRRKHNLLPRDGAFPFKSPGARKASASLQSSSQARH